MLKRVRPAIALWCIAVLGAAAVLLSPITPWTVAVEVAGALVCLAAVGALLAWLLR